MKRNGNGRAARLRGRVGRLVAGLVCCAGTVVAASSRLTYVGESNGVWTASGSGDQVWTRPESRRCQLEDSTIYNRTPKSHPCDLQGLFAIIHLFG